MIMTTALLLVVGVLSICAILFQLGGFILNSLHKLLPVRGIGESYGSLQQFSNSLCQFDIPWTQAITFAAVNGAVGFILIIMVPSSWSMVNPIIHITWEVRVMPSIYAFSCCQLIYL